MVCDAIVLLCNLFAYRSTTNLHHDIVLFASLHGSTAANRESSPLLETEGARYRPTVSSPINEALSPTEDVPLKATDTS